MSAVTINVSAGPLAERMARLAKAVEPKTILQVIGLRLLSYVDESFKTRGRGQWKPLAWSTLALRKRGGDAPLQDTGRYKQSFVSETDERTYVEVGTNLKTETGLVLAKIHEFGTGPFTIRVKTAKVLAAQIGQGAGGAGEHGPIGLIGSRRMTNWLFFGKEVHHPGVPARPVLPDQATAERLVEQSAEEMLQMEAARDGSA